MSLARTRIALPPFNLFHTRGLTTLLAWTLAVCALGLTAYWTNRLVSPSPVAALPVTVQAPRSATAEQDMARVFGVRTGTVEASLDGVALTGVFAPQGGKGGFATFRTAKGGAGVTVGQDIVPGLRLERVEATRVVVSSGSGERILELPRTKPATGERIQNTGGGNSGE